MTIDLRKTAIAALAALSLVPAAAAPAHALGKKDKAFIAGAATAAVAGVVMQNMRANGQWPFGQQQPRYAAPPAQPQYYVQPRATMPPPPRVRSPTSPLCGPERPFHARSPGLPRALAPDAARGADLARALRLLLGLHRRRWGPGTSAAVDAYARDSGRIGQLGSVAGATA